MLKQGANLKQKVAAFALAAVLALCMAPALAFAEGGNGSGGGNGGGNGGGGGQSGPTLSASSPEEGATIEAGTTPEMWLQFSNNVAESTVSAGNIEKVHLQKADGTEVLSVVTVRDTASDSEHRQYIYVTPTDPLEASTTYVLVADAGITAKNGSSSAEAYKVTFTTDAGKQLIAPADSAASASTSASASAAASASASASAPAATTTQSGSNTGLIVGVVIAVVVVAGAAVAISRKKK